MFLVVCVVCSRSLFSLLFYIFGPLCCLSVDIQFLITPLEYSNFISTVGHILVLIFYYKHYSTDGHMQIILSSGLWCNIWTTIIPHQDKAIIERLLSPLERIWLICVLCLTPLSAIFQLYHGDQFYWWKKAECTRLAAASDKAYHLLAHSRWFSPGTPASSTTKTGRHDIVERGVKHNKSNQIKSSE